MLLLGLDTCGGTGSVALARLQADAGGAEKLTLLAQTEMAGKTYSAQLTPAIRDLLTAQGVTVPEIGAIVVTSGPGSFTGIRIGLSTAKGLAEAASIPIVAVSRLAVLAWKAGTNAAALDASRHEFYFREDGPESLVSREGLVARGTALGAKLAVCEGPLLAVIPGATLIEPPAAVDAIQSVLGRLTRHEFDDPLLLDGNYLRRSDAEIFSGPGATGRRA